MEVYQIIFSWLITAVMCGVGSKLEEVAFIIMSQSSTHHQQIAKDTEDNLRNDLVNLGVSNPFVVNLQRDLPMRGSWTYLPIFPKLNDMFQEIADWYVFLHETSVVNVENFEKMLQKYDHTQDIFFGYVITDQGNTLIHGFEKGGVTYPDAMAGFVLSRSIVKEVSKYMLKRKDFVNYLSCDPTYELAKVIQVVSSAINVIHEPTLCTSYHPDCAIYPRQVKCSSDSKKSLEILEQTLFAVKTCQYFHQTRLPVIKVTWAKDAKNIIFVSDHEDQQVGTVVLQGGEVNTIKGHCRKTQAILNYFTKNSAEKNWKWLVITDDDTLISIPKVIEMMQCYDSYDEMIAFGERYGHQVSGIRGRLGFDYPAGGGGMIFNKKLVDEMMTSNEKGCRCFTPSQPDDFYIGQCLQQLNVPLIHSNRFHQCQPKDYNTSLLERQDPISFHKFEESDPIEIFTKWLKIDYLSQENANVKLNDEL